MFRYDLSVRPIQSYRDLARELCEYACNGSAGRPESDPIYQDITEGRDVGTMVRKYSSCGDLPHWMLFRLGVRLPWINRAEHGGWTVGANIWKLEHTQATRVASLSDRYECGDVLRIGDSGREHVFVVLEHDGNIIHSADYGQPGGEFRSRSIAERDGRPYLGGRIIGRWLPLGEVLNLADARGDLTEPDVACLKNTLSEVGRPTLSLGSHGRHVSDLQRKLGLLADGRFGMQTLSALLKYQTAHGLTADGICGQKTWGKLYQEGSHG